jgi:hypothetical protein
METTCIVKGTSACNSNNYKEKVHLKKKIQGKGNGKRDGE